MALLLLQYNVRKHKKGANMKNIINLVCLPLVILAAVNYGLIGVFDYDVLSLLPDATLLKIVQVLIGIAGIGLATGWYGKN
jgi:uncharacterized membrane protein YuzA (DUF378 family)